MKVNLNIKKIDRTRFMTILSSVIILSTLISYQEVNLTFSWTVIFNNFTAFVGIIAVVLIPLIIYLILTYRNRYAFLLSAVFILCQIYSFGFLELFLLTWYEYVLNIVGIGFVIFLVQKGLDLNRAVGILSLGVCILYISWLVFLTIFSFNLDVYSSLLLYILLTNIVLYQIQKREYFGIKLFIFYSISCLLISLNMNCNIEYKLDVGFLNWNPKNLWAQCSSSYLYFLGGMILNSAAALNLREGSIQKTNEEIKTLGGEFLNFNKKHSKIE